MLLPFLCTETSNQQSPAFENSWGLSEVDILADVSHFLETPKNGSIFSLRETRRCNFNRSVIINHLGVRLGSQLAAAFPSSVPISRINYNSCILWQTRTPSPPPPCRFVDGWNKSLDVMGHYNFHPQWILDVRLPLPEDDAGRPADMLMAPGS